VSLLILPMQSVGRGTIRRMVEGKRATIEDRRGDPIEAVHHIGGRDAERLDAVCRKRRITESIAFGVVAHVVRGAVDLDRELRLRAIEIEHEAVDRVLSAKPNARRSLS
jgi:hypothetical protein